ncbi:MAG TPA: LPS assembly lipoprotein LptE [Verrucomicrobiota bacterium]|nr:LPS assembly lipoprotein LptE [Verrucomicrobiota bacterium]
MRSTLNNIFSINRFFPFIVLSFFLCGCAGYKLGPVGGIKAGEKSVQINPFINQTIEPRLGEAVTSAMRKRIQTDGTYRLNTGGTGDIIVNGVITDFVRSPLSFQSNDLISVKDYYLEMKAEITAVERSTGKVIFKKTVTGNTTINVGNDLASGERQALPLLAEDIARKAVSLLADGEW